MGGDGGAFHNKRSALLEKQKFVKSSMKKTNNYNIDNKCTISNKFLEIPIVSDKKGNMYNKNEVIKALIIKKKMKKLHKKNIFIDTPEIKYFSYDEIKKIGLENYFIKNSKELNNTSKGSAFYLNVHKLCDVKELIFEQKSDILKIESKPYVFTFDEKDNSTFGSLSDNSSNLDIKNGVVFFWECGHVQLLHDILNLRKKVKLINTDINFTHKIDNIKNTHESTKDTDFFVVTPGVN